MAIPPNTDIMISARMFDLDISPTKSLVVSMLTKSISLLPPVKSFAKSIVAPCAGVYRKDMPSMTDAAITAIKTETSRTKLMILPSFFKSLMLAIDDITLMPINGTIIINSMKVG